MSELQQLRDRVAELEDLLGMMSAPALRQVLRPAKNQWLKKCEPMMGILLARHAVSKEQAFTALYGGLPEADQPEPKMIDIVVHRLRQALTPHGIEIAVVWGVGWYMTEENKAKLRALIEAHK